MIKNGNYEDIYDGIKDYIIEAFVKYYGEKYRDVVEKKINSTEVIGFDTREYLERYYDEYILKFRDEILDTFYKKLGMKRNLFLDSLIWSYGKPLSFAEINIAAIGGCCPEDFEFTVVSEMKIKNCRQNIYDYIGSELDDKDEKEKYRILKLFRKAFVDSVKEIEAKHPCDVFTDIDNLEKNIVGYSKAFLKEVDKYYALTDDDRKMLDKPDLDLLDIYNTDNNAIFMNCDLGFEGSIEAFTSDNNEILDDEEASENSKLEIIIDRLMYLADNTDAQFHYFEKDSIYDLRNRLNAPIDSRSRQAIVFQIFAEYDYQRDNFILNDRIKLDKKSKIKAWSRGEFVPSVIADSIEGQRRSYASLCQKNLMYYKTIADNVEEYQDVIVRGFEGLNQRYFKDDIIYNAFCKVFIKEENASIDMNTYLATLVHELNHSMTLNMPYEISKKYFKTKTNITHNITEHNNLTVGDFAGSTTTDQFEEYINERQTQEIMPILHKILEENDVEFDNDGILEKPRSFSKVHYNFYEFLLEDFYELFRDELRTINVEDNFAFNFDFSMPVNNGEKIVEKITRRFKRIFGRKKYFCNGLVDIHYISELGALVDCFNEEISPFIARAGINNEEFKDRRNWLRLPKAIQMKLFALLKKKNKLMAKIHRDLMIKKEYLDKDPDAEENEHFVSLSEFMDNCEYFDEEFADGEDSANFDDTKDNDDEMETK